MQSSILVVNLIPLQSNLLTFIYPKRRTFQNHGKQEKTATYSLPFPHHFLSSQTPYMCKTNKLKQKITTYSCKTKVGLEEHTLESARNAHRWNSSGEYQRCRHCFWVENWDGCQNKRNWCQKRFCFCCCCCVCENCQTKIRREATIEKVMIWFLSIEHSRCQSSDLRVRCRTWLYSQNYPFWS